MTNIFDAIIIGSGAAGFSAAVRLYEKNIKNICIITEGINSGTSRNTGSDKQTYYKIALGGDAGDSVRSMAETLFDGGCVDGDIALCEASCSARCFLRLCEMGVPFPHNEYGEYTGYKTDHDPFERATSAGPLTSKYMTEALQKKAEEYGIKIFDNTLCIEIIKDGESVEGVLCVSTQTGEYQVFKAPDIIMATGGAAGVYEDSVYPESQCGFMSLAIKAGASFSNITEWQYGIASMKPRWNVSGTYMQCLPRFVSVDKEGREREFLNNFFDDEYTAMSMVFLKGYQWPFDIKKAKDGSSFIDLLVYREKVLFGRKVFLDFTKNPFNIEKIEYESLSEECYSYLKKADAFAEKPVDRLIKMNSPAYLLYKSKGVDIKKEYLEISLCAQHCNGGISVDSNWQTDIKGLYAVGECAGTHGITRPGGSALNSGQTGALRAAENIERIKKKPMDTAEFEKVAEDILKKEKSLCFSGDENVFDAVAKGREKMSSVGGAVRNIEKIKEYLSEIEEKIENIQSRLKISQNEISEYYRLCDMYLMQKMMLEAFVNYYEYAHTSRGSALYTDKNGGNSRNMEEVFSFVFKEVNECRDKIQRVKLQDGKLCFWLKDVNPIPKKDESFEIMWKNFRENQNKI